MKIKEFDYDVNNGFAWIIVDGKDESDMFSVQCCLFRKEEEEFDGYEKKIIANDCGHDWGLCGDANEDAFNYWGENRCMKALFSYAKQNGIEVVGV